MCERGHESLLLELARRVRLSGLDVDAGHRRITDVDFDVAAMQRELFQPCSNPYVGDRPTAEHRNAVAALQMCVGRGKMPAIGQRRL